MRNTCLVRSRARYPRTLLFGVFVLLIAFAWDAVAQCVEGPSVKLSMSFEPYSRLKYRTGTNAVGGSLTAKYYSGQGCPDIETSPVCLCSHDDVTFTASISGPGSCEITNVENTSATEAECDFVIHDGFGSFTISVSANGLTGGTCPEINCVQQSHQGKHGGASASMSVTVWQMQLNPSPATFERADPASVTVQFLGGVSAISPYSPSPGVTVFPFRWKSETGFLLPNHTIEGTNSSWGGKIVTDTVIKVLARVRNPYASQYGMDPNQLHGTSNEESVELEPDRRADWLISVPAIVHDGDSAWQSSGDPQAFPCLENYIAPGNNTNADSYYKNHPNEIVTPVYEAPHLTNNPWGSQVTKVDSGPNMNIWYNSDKSMYTVARMSRLNAWWKPGAGKPSTSYVPATFTNPVNPSDPNNGYTWTNWLDLCNTVTGYSCSCTNATHTGNANNRWDGNVSHEEDGYGGPNKDLLGHQVRIEKAVQDFPAQYDAIYKVEGLLCPDLSDDALVKDIMRQNNENIRDAVSEDLLTETMALHTYTTSDDTKHNFNGQNWIWNTGTDSWWPMGGNLF